MAQLIIPDEVTLQNYTVTAAQTVFPITFAVFSKADIHFKVGTVELSQADFTFSGTPLDGGGYQGGTITLNVAVSATTCVAWRQTQAARGTNYAPAPTIPVRDIDVAFNRLTAVAQDLKRDVAGGIPTGIPSTAFAQSLLLGADATAVLSMLGLNGLTKTVLQFGAKGDGVTSDVAAFSAADAAGAIYVPPGNYVIDNNLAISKFVTILPGALLVISPGKTLTFNGGLSAAPNKQIFSGSGVVVFGPQTILEGYPEWWGAVRGGPDCYAAIMSCLTACDTTRLGPGDYYHSATVKMLRGHQRLWGAGSEWENSNTSTSRLLVMSGSLDTLQVGPDVAPATINQFQKQNEVKDVYLSRTVPPVIASGCSGLKAQYLLYAHFQSVKANEGMNGIQFYGCVSTIAERCAAVRESAGTGAGTDNWKGIYCNGFAAIGAAGGNASLYLITCRAACNNPTLSVGISSGFYADNNFTDLFWRGCETVSCATGMNIQGNTNGLVATNTDFQIEGATNDAFTKYGILVNNVNPSGSVEIQGGYYGAGTGALYALLIQNSYGVAIRGGEFVMLANATCVAIGVLTSRGIAIDGSLILEATAGPVVLNAALNCRVTPMVKNYINVIAAGAVALTGGSSRNYVQPTVMGGAAKIAAGVTINSVADTFNEVACSLIDPACLAVAANKLTSAGAAVAVAGVFNTNCLASGIMN